MDLCSEKGRPPATELGAFEGGFNITLPIIAVEVFRVVEYDESWTLFWMG